MVSLGVRRGRRGVRETPREAPWVEVEETRFLRGCGVCGVPPRPTFPGPPPPPGGQNSGGRRPLPHPQTRQPGGDDTPWGYGYLPPTTTSTLVSCSSV